MRLRPEYCGDRPPDAAPFLLEGAPGAPAALLLHGLTGSPFEMRHVAERLHRDGFRCRGPVMAGHEGDPRALAGMPWRAWVDGAARELLELSAGGPVALVGCSMGALVACALADAYPDRVRALALLAPALQLNPLLRAAGAAARVPAARRLPLVRKGPSDVADPEMRRRNPCLPAIPITALPELLDLARHVDAALPRLRAPALVVAGAHDHTVTRAGARRLAQRIGGGPAGFVVLPRSWHLVGIDVDRDACAEEVAVFLGRAARAERRSG